MIKAYLDQNQITLVEDGKQLASFSAGAAATDSLEISPYKLFSKSGVKKGAILDKLYASRHLPLEEQLALFAGKSFTMSVETKGEKAAIAIALKTAEDLLIFELLVVLRSGRPLKKCEHCGEYFFPQGRSDAVYCDRVGADGFSCKKIGAHRQYRKNSRIDDVKAMYDKITKHNRYLKNRGVISQWDYDRWMTAVSESYADYKNGKLSERTLLARLSEEVAAPTRSARRDISDYLL